MGDVARDWFDPARLFDEGYPRGITSALRELTPIRQLVRDTIRALAPRRLLEVGPGDAPVGVGLARCTVFLDVVPRFLAPLGGDRVRADLFAAPFAPGAFDVVVASDVLTHVRPSRRTAALAALAELGRAVVVFNPEAGTQQVADSPVPSRPITDFFETRGWRVVTRKLVTSTLQGDYVMRLVQAQRP